MDILIVGYLVYVIYRLLKGTMAFNIFVGVILFYILYMVVVFLDMKLLGVILGKFVGFGVLILIMIFQPEIRKFLLMIGNNTIKGRFNFINKFIGTSFGKLSDEKNDQYEEIIDACAQLSTKKMGALMVFTEDENIETTLHSGTKVDALLSSELLQNIFWKNSPLHDGAVIVRDGRIVTAASILPVSENPTISKKLGLRHRAGIGITEVHNVFCITVSEETGNISYIKDGNIEYNISLPKLKKLLSEKEEESDKEVNLPVD